jgi:hypothetical protein
MLHHSIGLAVFAALFLTSSAQAFDDAQYPNFRGQWSRPGSAAWDPTRPGGLGQRAPLIPEYQVILEANLKARNSGSQDYNAQAFCYPSGMPRMMIAYEPLEFIVTPQVTYIRSDHLTEIRHIYTDGRDWPATIRPAFTGYSIGKWVDDDGDGKYDALEVETRGFKGPRAFDANGIDLHKDNKTVIKERFSLDKSDPNLLHDQVTTIDDALTRPWTVTRDFAREPKPIWLESDCHEGNGHVSLRGESYFIGGDGFLMPTRKGQPAPDLHYFSQNRP